MKKLLTLCMVAALIMGSCQSKQKEEQLRQAQAMAEASKEELSAAVADRDQLLSLVNEISGGMAEIKRLENILTVTDGTNGETIDQRAQIQADIAAIQEALKQRRVRLEELERKLASSNLTTGNLRETIQTLRSQIDSQTAEIESLRASLDEARTRIGDLDAQVDSLNTTVTAVTAEKEEAQQQSVDLANELNTCYYAIGNNSELKDRKIIETGFLRRTKLLEGDFDRDFFTCADKRTLTIIDLNSDKAEVLTKQPAGSYVIEEANGHKVLRITDPDKFWNMSNYLVVKID